MAMCSGAEHRLEFVNAAFEELVGRTGLVGKTVREALPELANKASSNEAMRCCRPAGRSGRRKCPSASSGMEAARRSCASSTSPISRCATRMARVIGIFAAGYDVTDQKKAREEVQALQSDLIHMSRLSAMGTMASTLAHELNQPLTAITSYISGVQRLLESEGPVDRESLGQALDRTKANAHRAGEVIRRLRDMTMRGKSRRGRFNICEAVTEACSLAVVGVDENRVETNIDIPESLTAWGDKTQIQQVLLNLIRNALEAAPEDCARIGITGEASRNKVRVCISDNGGGIDPEAMETLFEPFISTKDHGIGIGLLISRTIIQSQGGRIWVERSGKKGTTICFNIAQRDERGEDQA